MIRERTCQHLVLDDVLTKRHLCVAREMVHAIDFNENFAFMNLTTVKVGQHYVFLDAVFLTIIDCFRPFDTL